MALSEFKKEDYWHIKGPLVSLVLSVSLVLGLFFGLKSLNTAAAAELRKARNELNQARDSVAKIEQEEATIVEYIGRYQQLVEDGVLSDEDRLQFQEDLYELQKEFSLFPVHLYIEKQSSLPLKYRQDISDPGRPISLRSSTVKLSLALLHEDDLARLLSALLAKPGLLQPVTCSLKANARPAAGYIYLAQHMSAECTLQWYTFLLPPSEAEDNAP